MAQKKYISIVYERLALGLFDITVLFLLGIPLSLFLSTSISILMGVAGLFLIVQWNRKMSSIPPKKHDSLGISAKNLIKNLLKKLKFTNITIIENKDLNCYSPKTNSITLQESLANSSSPQAIILALHELAHAIQHKKYKLISNFLDIAYALSVAFFKYSRLILIIGFFWFTIMEKVDLFYPLIFAFIIRIYVVAVEWHSNRIALKIYREEFGSKYLTQSKQYLVSVFSSYIVLLILDIPLLFIFQYFHIIVKLINASAI